MPRPIPFPTKKKPAPAGTETVPSEPIVTDLNSTAINPTAQIEENPTEIPINKEVPKESPPNKEVLSASAEKEEMPSDYIEENCVTIDGKKIEIKPTKVAYFRNKAASTYNLMKNIPLTELFGIKKGVLDENRDGDQIVYDFLVAALDDKEFVRDKYNDLNADQIERIVQIFGRLNHIEDKYENQRKNREAQGSH
jgi:hypothetical protein